MLGASLLCEDGVTLQQQVFSLLEFFQRDPAPTDQRPGVGDVPVVGVQGLPADVIGFLRGAQRFARVSSISIVISRPRPAAFNSRAIHRPEYPMAVPHSTTTFGFFWRTSSASRFAFTGPIM